MFLAMKKGKNGFCVKTKKEIKHAKVVFFFFSSFLERCCFWSEKLRAIESSWRGSAGHYWSKARQRELAIPYVHQFSSKSRLRTVLEYSTLQKGTVLVRERQRQGGSYAEESVSG